MTPAMHRTQRPKPVYPPGWKAFSRMIRYDRAEGQCECHGLCGLHRRHGDRRCMEVDRQPAQWAKGIVILTVAHICTCDPPCIRADHVLACCNRCHLRIDIPLHARHAAEGRRARREREGQLSFLNTANTYVQRRIQP